MHNYIFNEKNCLKIYLLIIYTFCHNPTNNSKQLNTIFVGVVLLLVKTTPPPHHHHRDSLPFKYFQATYEADF
jgi:hypothetical protein